MILSWFSPSLRYSPPGFGCPKVIWFMEVSLRRGPRKRLPTMVSIAPQVLKTIINIQDGSCLFFFRSGHRKHIHSLFEFIQFWIGPWHWRPLMFNMLVKTFLRVNWMKGNWITQDKSSFRYFFLGSMIHIEFWLPDHVLFGAETKDVSQLSSYFQGVRCIYPNTSLSNLENTADKVTAWVFPPYKGNTTPNSYVIWIPLP